jgi:hypothetical protein
MSKTMTGEIVAKARNGKGIALNIDGEDTWFNAKSEDQIPEDVDKGDVVEFEYGTTRKGGRTFNNIEGDVEIVEKGAGGGSSRGGSRGGGTGRSSGGAARAGGGGRQSYSGSRSGGSGGDKDRQIVRQNALTQANKLVETFPGLILDADNNDPEDTAKQIIELAKVFEEYVFS